MKSRIQQTRVELAAATANWAEARRNFPPNAPERMTAKDRYNRAVMYLVLAQDRRQPYG